MSEPLVLVEREERIATVTLNRPRVMNALSRALREELARTLRAIGADPDVGVVILTGAGRGFCAGLDLRELGSPGLSVSDTLSDDVMTEIERLEQPLIGAVNGVAVTGGFELALACDVLVATPGACFADTHARVGILPGWGLSQKLSRLIGIHRAKELSLTGNFLSAQTALEWGLVNRVVPAAALLETCRVLARDMLSCVPGTLRAYKQLIDRGHSLSLREGLALEQDAFRAGNASVAAGDIAGRRKEIQARGRGQAGEGGEAT